MHLCKVAGRQHRSILLKLVKYLHSHAKCFTNIQPLRVNNLNAFSLIETPGLTITMNAYTHHIKKNQRLNSVWHKALIFFLKKIKHALIIYIKI